jgi:hypothetical protein
MSLRQVRPDGTFVQANEMCGAKAPGKYAAPSPEYSAPIGLTTDGRLEHSPRKSWLRLAIRGPKGPVLWGTFRLCFCSIASATSFASNTTACAPSNLTSIELNASSNFMASGTRPRSRPTSGAWPGCLIDRSSPTNTNLCRQWSAMRYVRRWP